MVAYANTGDEEQKVEIFGVKIKLNKILDADKSSVDQTMYELPFEVTSSDFVRIDGVPYIKPKE